MSEKYEIRCPNCEKQMLLTGEELRKTGGHAVCPQCLCEFMPPGIILPAAEVTETPSPTAPHVLFCHNCGERLPAADLRFCPFCGAGLFSVAAASVAAPIIADEPVAHPVIVEEREKETPIAAAPDARRQYRLKGAPMITTFKRELTREELMGPLWLRLVCYVTIFVLAALFVALIIAIINEP